MGRGTYSWRPQKTLAQTETGILTAQRTDWRCEHEGTRRRNVSWLCAASWLCEKRSLQIELSKIFNKSILYFPAQVHFFLCTVNVIFIIFIYLFKLTVFIETLTTFNRFENNDVTVVFLYFLLDNIYLWNEKQTMQKLLKIFSKEIWCIIIS